jgi:flagellar biosynthesis anti-sigma factor FlgM
MRIPSQAYVSSSHLQLVTPGKVERGAPESTQPEARRQADVDVSVSDRARAMASDSGVDAAKVEQLRRAVEAGTLSIDRHAIAERMLTED